MEEKHSAKFLRQRKMMMVLPLLTLPFITMAFRALGGGQTLESKADVPNSGFNLKLPDAYLKDDKNADKLSFYKEAEAASLKQQELLRSDPNYKSAISNEQSVFVPDTGNIYNPTPPNNNLHYSPYDIDTDVNEQRIYQKINELNRQINQPDIISSANSKSNEQILTNENNEQFSNDVDRLQNMIGRMSDEPEVDPEMQQLNGTLDKILDIQNPERIKDRMKEKSKLHKETVYAVSEYPAGHSISLLDTIQKGEVIAPGFYGTDNHTSPADENNSIEAVVHENQILVSGAVIKLRLLTDVYINGILIPKDNFVFGNVSLNDERLAVSINSIKKDKSLFPVSLEVYDLDGLPGIYIPGAISREVAKQSADNSLQLLEITAMDPSLKAQAAASGINAAKTFLSKKVKQIKVMVKAGYKILLKDKSIQ